MYPWKKPFLDGGKGWADRRDSNSSHHANDDTTHHNHDEEHHDYDGDGDCDAGGD